MFSPDLFRITQLAEYCELNPRGPWSETWPGHVFTQLENSNTCELFTNLNNCLKINQK